MNQSPLVSIHPCFRQSLFRLVFRTGNFVLHLCCIFPPHCNAILYREIPNFVKSEDGTIEWKHGWLRQLYWSESLGESHHNFPLLWLSSHSDERLNRWQNKTDHESRTCSWNFPSGLTMWNIQKKACEIWINVRTRF